MIPLILMSPCDRKAAAGLPLPSLVNVTVTPAFKVKLEKVKTSKGVPACVVPTPANEAPPVITPSFKSTTTLVVGLKLPSEAKFAALRKASPDAAGSEPAAAQRLTATTTSLLRARLKNIPGDFAAGQSAWLRCSSVTDLSPICSLLAPRHPHWRARNLALGLFLKHALSDARKPDVCINSD
jgi:hypothetical protein